MLQALDACLRPRSSKEERPALKKVARLNPQYGSDSNETSKRNVYAACLNLLILARNHTQSVRDVFLGQAQLLSTFSQGDAKAFLSPLVVVLAHRRERTEAPRNS